MRKFTWNSDKVLSISAFVVSIATLLALLYQVQLAQNQVELARKGQKASVLPYIEIWPNALGRKSFSLELVNNGIGPAFVEEISVLSNGEIYSGHPYSFYLNVIRKVDTISLGFAGIYAGRVIPAGDKVKMIETTKSEKDADLLEEWFGIRGKAKVKIKYSSVYGEQWVTEGYTHIHKAVKDKAER